MRGKVVVITGGSSGIGKALAREFGERGCRVLITGRRKPDLDAAVSHLLQYRIDVAGFQADVSNEDDNRRTAEEAMKLFGRIDILINNAGISMRSLFDEVEMKVIRQVLDINFFGAVYATRYCLPEIIKNKGSIVGISSIAGFRGLPGRTGYSASKFALNGFLEALRTELLHTGVHVLTACPGFTSTNIRARALTRNGEVQHESPRDESSMMSAEECARQIYRATLRRRKLLILTLQGKFTVFLNRLWPSLMDRLVFNELAKEKDSPLH